MSTTFSEAELNQVTVLGHDGIGAVAVHASTSGFRYYLTDCCGASATASGGAIVCRECYYEVDWWLGDLPPKGKLPEAYGDGIPWTKWWELSAP